MSQEAKSSVVLYHNPSCSKSREAKTYLEEKGIDFTVKLYKNTGLNQKELLRLIELTGCKPGELVRTTDAPFKAAPFDITSKSEVAEKLAETPALLQRPIVVVGDSKAAIGRPNLAPIEALFE